MIKKVLQHILSGQRNRAATPAPADPPADPPAEPPAEPQESPRAEDQPSAPRRRRRRRRKAAPSTETSGEQRPVDAPPEEAWTLDGFQVEPSSGQFRFHDLDLPLELMRAIGDLGFQYCTPIQAGILPHLLEGKDAAGRAQTGTGKTAAFLISMFNRFLRHPLPEPRKKGTPRALVMVPTRELAAQIERDARDLAAHCGFGLIAVYGGIDYTRQRDILREQVIDLCVATPGRLLDYLNSHDIHLGHVEVLVIDEADRMLDMGFIPDIRRIVRATPPRRERQTLLFSATLSPEVTRLASQWVHEPVTIDIEPEQVDAESVEQRVYIVTARQKLPLLVHLLKSETPERVILFVNRRDEAERLSRRLTHYEIPCEVLSGAVPQNKRMRTLERFRAGEVRVLVATDVAGRGLHVEGISHIINYNVPMDSEDYVHRIGRTGRAGATGKAVTFACEEESFYLPDIEAFIGHDLIYKHPPEEWLKLPPSRHPDPDGGEREGSRRRPPSRSGNRASRGPRQSAGPRRGGRR